MEPSVKKVFFRAVGFGAGFAVVAAIGLGMTLLWVSRPYKPKPWNSKAVTASFQDMKVYAGDAPTAEFIYRLQNNTDSDYTLPERPKIMSRDTSDTLSAVDAPWTQVKVFIPAHKAISYSLDIPYGDIFDAASMKDDRHAQADYINKRLEGVAGFTLFDESDRYEIVFPPGWNIQKK